MRLTLPAALVLASTVVFPAHADIFSIEAEAQYWNPDGSGSDSLTDMGEEMFPANWDRNGQLRLSASFQHFIPLIPNVRLETQELDFTGSSSGFDGRLDLGHDTFTLFYAPLDNDLTRLHFGVSLKRVRGYLERDIVDGPTTRDEIDADIPMVYLLLETSLPFTGLSVQGSGHFFSFDDNEIQDIEAAVRYRFLDNRMFEGYISAGYRSLNFKIDEGQRLQADYDFRGPFVSVNLRF